MAAGVPVVATNHSACVELLGGPGELVDVAGYITAGRHNVDYAIFDLVAKMEYLYRGIPQRREAHRRAGRDIAATLDWSNVVTQWAQVLTERSSIVLTEGSNVSEGTAYLPR